MNQETAHWTDPVAYLRRALAQRLRADARTRSMRLVALTGYGTAEDRRRALAAGFDEHLAKPVELAALEGLFASLAAQQPGLKLFNKP